MPPPGPRPLPVATPETQHFWEGTAQGELRLQRCQHAARLLPAAAVLPALQSDDVEVVRASGSGRCTAT